MAKKGSNPPPPKLTNNRRSYMIEKHLELLGMKVKDSVTGLTGVVTCISFDLFGCIQAVVKPAASNKDGKVPDGQWQDVARLVVTGKKPVMDVPNFISGYVAEGLKGAAEKPISFTRSQ